VIVVTIILPGDNNVASLVNALECQVSGLLPLLESDLSLSQYFVLWQITWSLIQAVRHSLTRLKSLLCRFLAIMITVAVHANGH